MNQGHIAVIKGRIAPDEGRNSPKNQGFRIDLPRPANLTGDAVPDHNPVCSEPKAPTAATMFMLSFTELTPSHPLSRPSRLCRWQILFATSPWLKLQAT